jgi:hypothetical protein
VYCGSKRNVDAVLSGDVTLESTLCCTKTAKRNCERDGFFKQDRPFYLTSGKQHPAQHAAQTAPTAVPHHAAAQLVPDAALDQVQLDPDLDPDMGHDPGTASTPASTQQFSQQASAGQHAEAAGHHLADTPADLDERQPGSDGGQVATRAERHSYPKPPDQRTQALVTADMIECVILKSRDGMNERQAQAHLISKAAGYRRLGQHDVANALPTTFKAVLTALQDQGEEGAHGAQPVCRRAASGRQRMLAPTLLDHNSTLTCVVTIETLNVPMHAAQAWCRSWRLAVRGALRSMPLRCSVPVRPERRTTLSKVQHTQVR